MKTYVWKVLFTGCLAIFLVAGFIVPSHSNGPMSEWLENLQCVPDGNNNQVSATLIKEMAYVYEVVGAADTHDWYMLPLNGDTHWQGDLFCMTNGPGLRVALYVDMGSGIQLISEESPTLEVLEGGSEMYVLNWDILDIAADAGYPAAPPGNYYVRFTYYTYHPGDHPYMFNLYMRPADFDPSPYNSSTTARALAPGIKHFGHLDAADNADWFTFEIPPGQSGTGIIFAEHNVAGIMGVILDGGETDGPLLRFMPGEVFDVKLRDAAMGVIASTEVNEFAPAFIDLGASGPVLAPGTYYIEVIRETITDPDWEAYYMLFNHALAPDTGEWWADANTEVASATPLAEATPIAGTIYFPRDGSDYYSFSPTGNFLGDIVIEPAIDYMAIRASIINGDHDFMGGEWLPGIGVSCRFSPPPPGNYYLRLNDFYTMFYPTEYTLTYYEHGPAMTAPVGHDTWATALELQPRYGSTSSGPVNALIDFQPGVQDVYFVSLTVPPDNLLVGYYDIKGSRRDFRVHLGKLGPGGTPVWSPAITAANPGNIKVDMSYEYLSDPGTYFIKVEMLPSSPGRMRVLINNYSELAECAPDDNNTYGEAVNLKAGWYSGGYTRTDEVCPTEDDVDWYYFDSGYFDDTYGPGQFLRLRGGAAGMRIELYDGGLTFLADADVADLGGYAVIDVDGVIVSDWTYYVKVIANPAEERVQVYELQLRNDFKLVHPVFPLEKQLRYRFPYWEMLRRED